MNPAAEDAGAAAECQDGRVTGRGRGEDPGTSALEREPLGHRPYADVLVIGGGINGIAIFRDLAMQGVDVALVERGDFASGASAASSHMIHGGIRYLENGEFRLVHEAVTERNALLRTAPHYVRPLRTTIPIFSTFRGVLGAPLRFLRHGSRRPSERGAVLIKIGLVIYDSFSRGGGSVPRHTFHGRRRTRREIPELNREVKYTATYWDASLHDPERLALDVLDDAIAAGNAGRAAGSAGGERRHATSGAAADTSPDGTSVDRDDRSPSTARAWNYVEAAGVQDGTVVLIDRESGDRVPFTAAVVVNASGPWTDLTNDSLGQPTAYMGGTKGSHIVLDHPRLLEAVAGRELFFEHRDGRIVLIYPLKGRVLVGTTDLEHDMRDPARCTEEEVDYFFDLIGHVFPDIPVGREDIVYRFAGVRPLPGHGDLAPGFVSRDFRVESLPLIADDGAQRATLISLVGGKWTTFRAVAESVTNRVLEALAVPRTTSTRGVTIGGGRGYPTTERRRQAWIRAHAHGIDHIRVGRLLERYGTKAAAVIASIARDEADAPLPSLPAYSSAELRHLAVAERVVHLEDLVLRRTSMAFLGEASESAVRDVALAVAGSLRWDAERVEAEVIRALAAVRSAYPDESATPQAGAEAGGTRVTADAHPGETASLTGGR